MNDALDVVVALNYLVAAHHLQWPGLLSTFFTPPQSRPPPRLVPPPRHRRQEVRDATKSSKTSVMTLHALTVHSEGNKKVSFAVPRPMYFGDVLVNVVFVVHSTCPVLMVVVVVVVVVLLPVRVVARVTQFRKRSCFRIRRRLLISHTTPSSHRQPFMCKQSVREYS